MHQIQVPSNIIILWNCFLHYLKEHPSLNEIENKRKRAALKLYSYVNFLSVTLVVISDNFTQKRTSIQNVEIIFIHHDIRWVNFGTAVGWQVHRKKYLRSTIWKETVIFIKTFVTLCLWTQVKKIVCGTAGC